MYGVMGLFTLDGESAYDLKIFEKRSDANAFFDEHRGLVGRSKYECRSLSLYHVPTATDARDAFDAIDAADATRIVLLRLEKAKE